jgi:hypothetical protein
VRPAEAAAAILALVDGLCLQLTFEPATLSSARATRLIDDVLNRYLAPATNGARGHR